MHPIAFHIGNVAIHWYGVLVALGFLVGFWTATRRCLLDDVPGEMVADLIPWIVISALVGARLLFIIDYYNTEFRGAPWWDFVNIRRGGLVFHGGLIAAVVTTIVYTRWRRLPLWKLADALAPSIALGHVFGRLGCFMNGCCFGKVCSLPWAVHFPAGHPTAPHGVHPTELYEAALNLALYGALAWQYRRKRFAGQTFAIYLTSYGVLRFLVEFLRGDYPVHYFGWATVGQLVSLGVLVVGVGLWIWLARRARVTPAPSDAAPGEATPSAAPAAEKPRSAKPRRRHRRGRRG